MAKALDVETEIKTEATGFGTESNTEAVYLETEAEDKACSLPILLTLTASN